MTLDRARAEDAAVDRRAPVWAALLALLTFTPTALLFVSQALNIGHTYTVGGSVALSDSAGWNACASALAAGFTSSDSGDWCQRRPIAFILESGYFPIAPASTAAVMLVQTALLGLAAWVLLIISRQRLRAPFWALAVAAAILIWPIFSYGGSLGPEGVCLLLSLASASLLLQFLSNRRPWWGVGSAALLILALQARPGNIPLTVAVCADVVGVVYLSLARRRLAAGIGLGLVGLWLLPNQLLRLAGLAEAGNGGNFWYTVYSAATPQSDTWLEAKHRFREQLLPGQPESVAFERAKSAALELLAQDPSSFLTQLRTNIGTFLSQGFVNLAVGNPVRLAWDAGIVPATQPVLGLVSLVGFAASWLFLLTLVGALTLAIARRRRTRPWTTEDRVRTHLVVLGLVGFLGAAGFFAVAGHDEATRHLAQNIPFLLVAWIAGLTLLATARRPDRTGIAATGLATTGLTTSGIRAVGIAYSAVVLVVAVVAGAEGRVSPSSLTVASACDPGASTGRWTVVGSAPVHTSRRVAAPLEWRRQSQQPADLFLGEGNWLNREMDRLPPGVVLALREQSSGDVVGAFLADSDVSPYCFRTAPADTAAGILGLKLLNPAPASAR